MPEREDELGADLDDGAIDRRRDIVLAGHRGDRDAARAGLRDDDARVRASALGALARLDELDDAELLRALDDPSPIVRRRALAVAAATPRTDADPTVIDAALERLLDDDDTTVCETAAWAIGERPPASPSTVTKLCDLVTGHEDALCREAAVAALGALGDPAGLDSILRATTDRATVRRRAVIALAPFDGPEVAAALTQALDDRDWQVRQAAEDLLADD